MVAAAIALKRNIRDAIVEGLPSLIPQTTLSADAAAGATTITVNALLMGAGAFSGSSRIVLGASIGFNDGLGEGTISVADVDTTGTSITLATTPTFTGLQYTHTAGTVVYANIAAYNPWSAGAALALGDPMISITVLDGDRTREVQHGNWPNFTVHIQSNRLLNRDNTTGDPEMWANQQEDAVMSDIESIAVLLEKNPEVITKYYPSVAIQLGKLNQNNQLMRMAFGPKQVENTNVWHYIGTLQCFFVGVGEQV